jgi:Ala-tRNA(Pro) deacylase
LIPASVEAYLRERYRRREHRAHPAAATALDLAAATNVSGRRVGKVVVLRLGRELALAVVAATDRVHLAPLEEATGVGATLAPEHELAERFRPCEPGAVPPLALFGAPIFVDDALLRETVLLVPAGTHEDAVVLDTIEWVWCERVQPIVGLGTDAPRGGAGARLRRRERDGPAGRERT